MNLSDIIALDVSKGHSYCVVYHNQKCIDEFDCEHNQIGFKRLKQAMHQTKNPVIYFEATGVYSRPVARFCRDCQVAYVQLNPLELSLNTGKLRRVKADIVDAHKIAHSAMEDQYRLTTQWPKIYTQLRELNRFYARIEKDIKLGKERVDLALDQTFPEEEELFCSKPSKLSLNVILLYPHPSLVEGMSRVKLRDQLMAQTDKRLSKTKGMKYAEKLLKAAEISYPASDADSVQVTEVRYYCHQLIELLKLKERLIKKMTTLATQIPAFKTFCSVPGIGSQSAAQLLGELGDIHRFDKATQLKAYVGTDLNQYQSGKTKRQDHINKRGNTHARALMYNVVDSMIKQQRAAPNHIIDFYYRLKRQPIHPKKDKIARIACINKTLNCLYAMVIVGNVTYSYPDSRSINMPRK